MKRIIKSMEEKYLVSSLELVETVFTAHADAQEGKLVSSLVEEIRSKRVYLPGLELGTVGLINNVNGYVKSYTVIEDGKQGVIRITLKYAPGKQKIIRGLRRVSKPGLRIYAGCEDMPRVMNGLGIAIVSTSKGIMTDKKARQLNVGGEVLAFVW